MRRSRSSALRVARSTTSRGGVALVLAACGASAPAPATPAACPAGEVVIASDDDVARLASCTRLDAVTIRSGGAVHTARLAVAAITGELRIGPTVAVEEVTLGSLQSVGGAVRVVGNGVMQGLFLPKLARAGELRIDGNVALTTISLPALAEAAALRVTANSALELLDVSALGRVAGELVITGNPRLTLVEAGPLAAARVELDAPRLPDDAAAALRKAAP